MKKDKPYIDWRKVRRVSGRLIETFRKGEYPFQNYHQWLPQNILPPEIRKDRRACGLILFFSCELMRGTVKSYYAVQRELKLYLRRPEMFEPSKLVLMSQEEIEAELRWMLPYKVKEIAFNRLENSRRLLKHWGGDPRRIFDEVFEPVDLYRFFANKETTEDVPAPRCEREMGFLGMQKKMTGMITYYSLATDLFESEAAREAAKKLPWPMDSQNLRVFVSHGAIRTPASWKRARYEELLPYGLKIAEKILEENPEFNMMELCDIFWPLASVLCNKTPSNRTTRLPKEPGKKKGKVVRVNPNWDNETTIRQYARTCGACPVESTCAFSIPLAFYYDEGAFELGVSRPKPPVERKVFQEVELPHVMPSRKPEMVTVRRRSAPHEPLTLPFNSDTKEAAD